MLNRAGVSVAYRQLTRDELINNWQIRAHVAPIEPIIWVQVARRETVVPVRPRQFICPINTGGHHACKA